jgi:AraC-like DNA-binding protein
MIAFLFFKSSNAKPFFGIGVICLSLFATFLNIGIAEAQDTILYNIINFKNPIRSLAKDAKGLIYIQTSEGVFVLSKEKIEKSAFPVSNFDRIIVHKGELTSRKALEKQNIKHRSLNQNCDWQSHLPSSGSLNFCQVENDPSGLIWVSNGSKFLYCFKINNLFKRSIRNISIRGIEFYKDRLFVLTYSGLFVNGTKWLDKSSFGSSNIFLDGHHLLFASTTQIFNLDLSAEKFNPELVKINTEMIGEISSLLNAEGILYIGGFHGLYAKNGNGELVKESIKNEVHHLIMLHDKLYVCTAKGIYHLEKGKFIIHKAFPSQLVYNDIEERYGRFYAASAAGVWVFDGESSKAYNLFKNTPYENQECFAIEWDDYNQLWVSTAKGLIKFNLNDNNMDIYLSDFEFNKRSSYKRESNFYFGSTEGLFTFDAKDFSSEELSFQPKEEKKESFDKGIIFLLMLSLLSAMLSVYFYLKTKRRINNSLTDQIEENSTATGQLLYTMESIEAYILKHIKTITAESLREDSGLSKNLFYKSFSQHYDITPKQLIETIRRDHLRRKKNS